MSSKVGYRYHFNQLKTESSMYMYMYVCVCVCVYIYNNNSVALARERTIPTERSPPVGEVSANFLRIEGCHVVSAMDPHGR